MMEENNMHKRKQNMVIAAGILLSFSLSACVGKSTQQNTGQPQTSQTTTTASKDAQETTVEEDSQQTTADGGIAAADDGLTFPLGMAINSDTFTGTAYLSPMINNDEVYHFPQTNNVTFEPGARSGWHSHGGMILLVTGGAGYYQEEGKPAQIIRKGDVIECAPGVRHWHGAMPDRWFSQMVVYESHYVPAEGAESAEEPVTDEEYANLETEEYAGRTVTEDNSFMFQRGEEAVTLDTFNGPVYLSDLLGGDNVADAPGLHYVVFEPGVINNWHTHEGGQILIATDGIGYHQIEGQPVEVLHPGDVALCPPGVKQWHGGSADTSFAHIAVNTNPGMNGLTWFDRISDEEYSRLPTEKAEDPAAASGQENAAGAEAGNNILVAYFTMPETDGTDTVAGASRVVMDGNLYGNTQYLANLIQERTSGELFRIETVQEYPGEHDPLVDQAADEQSANIRPELASHIENLDAYDVIFLGYPNWWGDLPMPLYTFLEEYDFSGKTIVPFNSHGGSRFSGTIETIKRLQPGAEVITDGYTISRNDVGNAGNSLGEWLTGLGY